MTALLKSRLVRQTTFKRDSSDDEAPNPFDYVPLSHSWKCKKRKSVTPMYIEGYGEKFKKDKKVCSYEEAAEDWEETHMMETPAVRDLMDLAGISNRKKKQLSARTNAPRSSAADMKKAVFTKACTTELVGDVMESYFRHQIAGMTQRHPSGDGEKKRRNQIDEPCGLEGDEDGDATWDSSEKENRHEKREKTSQSHQRAMVGHGGVTWVGDPVGEEKHKKYFSKVQIGQELFRAGDAALFCCQNEAANEANTYVRRLEHLYEREDFDKTKMAHVSWFARGSETVLGDVTDEREVFRLVRCSEERLSNLVGRASVSYWPLHEDWRNMGGNKEDAREPPVDEEDPNSYWYRMSYDPECARFEHAPDYSVTSIGCSVCPEFKDTKVEAFGLLECRSDERERFQWAGFMAMGERFMVGDAVFLASQSSTGDASHARRGRPKREVDEDKYPEIYRYKSTVIKGSNERCPRPLQVGIIKEVYSIDPEKKGNERAIPQKRRFKICLRKLYRPEDTCLTADEAFAKDLNLVYWSEDFVATSDIARVRGKVTVRAESALQQRPEEWREEGTHRFYYKEAYNRSKRCFEELTSEAELYGACGKNKGFGKGGKGDSEKLPAVEDEGALPNVGRRLATLDIFSGCGGLSRGLHEAGVAEPRWAIELVAPAAKAFKANNPDCTVFTEDCNVLLDLAMKGRETNGKGQRLPRKGEIALLCGGPPCQGFSNMNRFNEREYSAFKNSLITTFLSYADFYRPRFFILENVRNFVSFKNSVVLKLCLRALLKIGYACTFDILQAGNFGVPQTRRRVIILAAAPGEELPLLPEPQTCFAKSTLHATIGDTSYGSNCRWREEAPYRTITVRDCMSDLPSIGRRNEDVMSYGQDPVSDFQRSMRRGVPDNGLRDHVRKIMSCLVDKRIEYIPKEPGADWRDLPNIVVKLADGTYTDKLVYRYDDFKTGRSKKGVKRGVCACKNGKEGLSCDPGDKQGNTLIPWCLPHTANRHNQWAGLYGRLAYDGHFSTTVTNPEPMGKQGRVLHPEEDRLISVRECARSQGFPDSYKFCGTILDKHRQIGNAVPPPMGRAIGTEIRKAMAKREQKRAAVIVK